MGRSSGPLGVARGIKGRGPRLTFDLKWPLQIKKWSQKKLELEITHPEILAILYTHLKMVVVVFLIDNQHNHVVSISIYTPMAATQQASSIILLFCPVFFFLIQGSLYRLSQHRHGFFFFGGGGGGGAKQKKQKPQGKL